MEMVRPITPPTPAIVVIALVSFEKKKTMYALRASDGTWSAIEMMTHSTTPTTRIAVLISRKRVGTSSRLSQPTQSESIRRVSRDVVLMELFRWRTFDDRDRGGAHPEKILVRIFDFDTDRKSLRHSDPVQLALHIRHAGRRQIDFAFRLNRPSDSLHFSAEALVRRGRKINNR